MSRLVNVLACFGALAASVVEAAASDDRLLMFLANPSVDLRPGLGTSIALDVLAHTQTGLPDGAAPVPGIAIDPKEMDVSYRRIDGTLRPWQRLSAVSAPEGSPPPDGAEAGSVDVSFASIPAVRGATYELRVGVGHAVAWMAGAPTPQPSEYDYVVNRLLEGACFHPDTASEIVDVITIPSVAVAAPDAALAAAKRAFVGHVARVLRAGAAATLDYASPHACDSNVPLTRGQRVKVIALDRIPKHSLGLTSVGPSGVPASADLPAQVERYAPDAITVLLAPSQALQADSITLIFASTDELRQFLAPL